MPAQHNLEATALRAYRGLLCLYPVAFRDEYGRELCLVFQDRWREERSPLAQFLLWLKAVLGILSEASKEHYHMILQDLRYAARIMRKDAAVTLAAIAILALGIGSATLVFSLANGLLIRPLPYPQQERILAVDEYSPKDPAEKGQMNFVNFLDIRARTRLLEDMGIYDSGSLTVRGDRAAEQVWVGDL